jgi:hypothetical protein
MHVAAGSAPLTMKQSRGTSQQSKNPPCIFMSDMTVFTAKHVEFSLWIIYLIPFFFAHLSYCQFEEQGI